jgi:hypothetical protein
VDPPAAESFYMRRTSAEHEMQGYLTGPPAAMLLFVGPNGAGNSKLVQHVLSGRTGTVAIKLTETMHQTDMYRAVAEKVCPGRPDLHACASEEAVLISLLKGAPPPIALRARRGAFENCFWEARRVLSTRDGKEYIHNHWPGPPPIISSAVAP